MIQDYKFCSADIIADSVLASNHGDRVTTFLLTYPRFIHAQMMTHRMAARNAQSSRAVPVQRMIDQVKKDPVIPVAFLANQKGMVGGEEVPDVETAEREWVRASRTAAASAEALMAIGVHKQHANRVLEPFLTITAVFTMQNMWLDHFFGLRLAHDAQPEIRSLANEMFQALAKSSPALKRNGDWHLPFLTPNEMVTIDEEDQPKCSAARCARASYLNFNGGRDPQEDISLFNRLVNECHPSPMEHVLTPMGGQHGVFSGWESVRSRMCI